MVGIENISEAGLTEWSMALMLHLKEAFFPFEEMHTLQEYVAVRRIEG